MDKSDEENCRMVNMEVRIVMITINSCIQGNYNKKVAPFTYDKATKKNTPASINVSMSIMDVLKIEEVNHVYTLKFRLILEWYVFSSVSRMLPLR